MCYNVIELHSSTINVGSSVVIREESELWLRMDRVCDTDALHTIVDQIIVVCIWDVHLSVFLSTDLCFDWTWK